MRKITFLLMFLGLLLSVQTYAQYPSVLPETDFSTKTGVIRDARDSKYYAYKKYGDKDWFMHNLNWVSASEVNDKPGPDDRDGAKYGRFYKVKTVGSVCPTGWHSPTTAEWKTLVIDVATERNLTDMMSPSTYDFYMVMHYMRGGGLASAGGLWLSNTGTDDVTETKEIQFNILPSGNFNGTTYTTNTSSGGGGIGQRTFLMASGNDIFRNNFSTAAKGYNTLKHHSVSSSWGSVRCVRSAQAMRQQIIIAEKIETRLLSDGSFSLVAKATSDLPLTYVSSNTAVAIVDANGYVTVLAVGETTITVSQTGDSAFDPAASEILTLTVNAKKFYLTLPAAPEGTIISPTTTTNMIGGDDPFVFSITRISGYEGEPAVTVGTGGTLTLSSTIGDVYTYSVTNITADLTVTISGITKIQATGQPKFATIADVHTGATDWEAKATKALDNLIAQSPQLDAIFITGDITDGGTQVQFEQLKALVDSKVTAGTSVYYTMGNNDWAASATASGEYFGTTFNQDLNQFIVIQGYPFITLSTESKTQADSYQATTLTFLTEKLAYAKTEYPGKPIFVIQPVPNYLTVYGSASKEWGTSSLTAELKKYPEVVSISGNSHYFLANENSIHQDIFTSINVGSVAYARMETGFDDGITPLGSETISEGVVITVDASNAVEIKRVDFTNSTTIKQPWTLTAPHNGSVFPYKDRTGGSAPFFDTGSVIAVTNLQETTATITFPVAKDDDAVNHYTIELVDIAGNVMPKPNLYKFVSDYYLTTSGAVATSFTRNLSGLVENTKYTIRVTAVDAFGQSSTPLTQVITTPAIDPGNPSDFDIIADRIRADHRGRVTQTANDAAVANALRLFNDTVDSFTDLNYEASGAADWSAANGPGNHIHRMKSMAIAYTTPSSNYFEDDNLYQKMVNGWGFWILKDPKSSNWWHGSIGNTKPMGIAMLMMRKGKQKLPASIEATLITHLERSYTPESQAGPNKTDIALHYLYRACLIKDEALVIRSFGQGFEPLKTRNSEGIQIDYSYFQHLQQLQLGSYGQELMKTTIEFCNYAVDTRFNVMTAAQLNVLSKFARETYFNIHRGRHIHYNSTGRSLSRAGNLKRFGSAGQAENMKKIDPTYADEYENIRKRIAGEELASYRIKPNNTSYFVGDYVIHTRPEFQFSVRMVSTRTVRSEWGNGEALQTYFVSDGGTSFLQKGDEYENIPVGWNWTRIPGTTAPQYPFDKVPKSQSDAYENGTSTFAGGVSDSIYSANIYYYENMGIERLRTPVDAINIKGFKSWFFFDNEVVALGAGIESTCVHPINTSVEQNLLKSDVVVSTTGGEETIAQTTRGEKSYLDADGLKWIWQNGAGYYFPNGGKVHTENRTTTRAWSAINKSQSTTEVNTDVFSIWFDHGQNPGDASYAYIVVPNKPTVADMTNYDASHIKIMANTPEVQAVRDTKTNVWQIIFSRAAKFEYEGITIESDAGAALILKGIGTTEVTMHIADPGQKGRVITILSTIPSVSADRKKTVCDFRGTGRSAGATKVFIIDATTTTLLTPDRTHNSPALADSYVDGGDKGKNNGDKDIIEIKLDGTAYRRQAYVKFSLDDIDKVNQEEYRATVGVEFFVTSANTGINTTNWVVYPVGNISWDEKGINWSNQPGYGADILDRVGSFAPVSGTDQITGLVLPSDIRNRVDFDISAYALSEYAKGNRVISLNINNDVPGGKVNSTFATKEHLNPLLHPKLVVKLYKKEAQTITFNPLAAVEMGVADFEAGATASSTLAVTYTSSDETVATIVAGKIHIVGGGPVIITASQAGDATYAAATNVAQTLIVTFKPQTITFATLADKQVGDADFEAGAIASSTLAVTYTSSKTDVATIVAGKIHIVGIGTTIITANQAGDATYAAAPEKTQALTVTRKTQTITFNAIASKQVGDADFDAGATTDSGLTITYTSSDTNVATIATDGKIHIVGIGTTIITANQAGDATYAVAPEKTQALTVTRKTQTITFNAIASKQVGDADFGAGATTDSGLTITYTSSDTNVATIATDGTIHIVGIGTTTITASQAGDTEYAAAPEKTQALTVTRKTQTITFATLPAKQVGAVDFEAGAIASSGLAVTYTSSDTNVATIATDGTIHIVGIGTTTITASQVGNAIYAAANDETQTLVVRNPSVTLKSQSITFNILPAKQVGDADFGAGATTDSGLTITYTSSDTNVATIATDGTIHIVGIGTTTITASQAGDATYDAATNMTQTLTVTLKPQTITFNAIASKQVGDADFEAGATTNSGLVITYTSSNAAVATIVSGKIHIVGAGTTTITASQAGNAEYKAATNVAQTLTVTTEPVVTPKPQTITFAALASKQVGSADFDAGATTNSGLVITYTSSNAAVATIVSGKIHIVGAGTTTITASQAGNAEYKAATNVAQTLTVTTEPVVTPKPQTITFAALASKQVGSADFDAGATTNSGLTITYTSSNAAVATIVSGKIHIVGAGTTTITASQAGNAEYNAATNVAQTLTVTTEPVVTPKPQTITFAALASKQVGSADFDAGATTNSGLTITYTSSNAAVATIVSGKIHIVGAGTTTITASQAGNAEYNAATNVAQTLTVTTEPVVTPKPQTITFAALASKQVGSIDFDAGATTNSGLTITYTSSNAAVATIVSGKIHIVGAGTTTITASQAGNAEYKAATNVAQTLTVTTEPVVTPKPQTITFAALASKQVGSADFDAGATTNSGLTITYTSSNVAVATIVSGKIHIVGAGTTTITASQAGNAEYKAATNVAQTLTVTTEPVVTPKPQTITFAALASKQVGSADFDAGATTNSGLTITYTSSNAAVATIVSGKIHIVGAGTTTITASQAGNAEYKAATNVAQTLTVTAPVVGGEVSINYVMIDNNLILRDLSQTYVVPQADKSKSTIEVKVDLPAGNTVVGSNPISINVAKPSIQDVTFTVKNGDNTKEYTLRVEKRFDFEEITHIKWGNTYIVNNNKDRNGGYKFVSYKWFKNDGATAVGTKQYYREVEKGKASFSVEMITEDGILLQTWPGEVVSRALTLKAYPNPVVSGQVLYLDASEMPSEFLDNATVAIYTTGGDVKMQNKRVTQSTTSLTMPQTPGVYLVKVVCEEFMETFKVIVK